MVRLFWDFGNFPEGGRLSYTPPEPIVGSWQHFAFVASESQNAMRIYRNGVLETEKEGMTPLTRGTGSFSIGGPEVIANFNNNGLSPLFGGRLADFRVWSVVRSADQILDGMWINLTGDEPNLVSLWRFDDGQGNGCLAVGQPRSVERAGANGDHIPPDSCRRHVGSADGNDH